MNKRITADFNSEIKTILNSKDISIHDGISFLLNLYYGVSPSYIPERLETKIFSTGIVSKNYDTGEIKWRMPLFEEAETGFEWIKDWMDLFKQVNPERRGVKADVLKRMKKFFVNNPAVRKDEVIAATKLYLKGISNAKYCKKSHKFIYEQDGTSMLLDFVQQFQEREKKSFIYKSDII